MPITYEPIATTTLSSAASLITFNSIPNTYTDLKLVLVAIANSSTIGGYIIYNNDSGANYSYSNMRGDGSTMGRSNVAPATQINLAFSSSASTTIPAFYTADIFSYAGSTFKSCLITSAANLDTSAGATEKFVGLWRNTTAITRLDIYTNAVANFGIGTTATIYGIKNA